MSKKQPAPPPPPNYAEANREAIQADIDTLPLRRLIEAQARLGVGDFQGLGDADLAAQMFRREIEQAPEAARALLGLQRELGTDFVNESRRQAAAFDPTGFALREGFGGRLGSGVNTIESLYGQTEAPDFAAYVRANPDLLANWQNNTSKNTNLSIEDYGRQHYEQSGRSEGRGLPVSRTGAGALPSYERVSDASPLAQFAGNAPEFERVGNAPLAMLDSGQSGDIRGRLEQQIGDELALGNALPPELQRMVEQAARARGVAVGDPLGNANVLRESLAVQRAGLDLGNQRRQNALGLLSSGQGVADRRNAISQLDFENTLRSSAARNQASQAGFDAGMRVLDQRNQASQGNFANSLQAIAQRNQATQNQFTGQQQVAGQRAGARQQDLANIQSFLGLTPVAAQAGLNQNAQGGAVPFQQMGYNGMNINPNAGAQGAQFAQGVFGTQAGIYGQQLQNSANPLAAIAGGFAGSLFGGLGTNLANKWIRPPTG